MFVLVVAVILLPGGWLLVERHRAKAALAKYEQQLRAKGEKLTFEELFLPIPEGDNKGPELLGLCSSLMEGPVLTLNSPPPMKLIAPGKGLVMIREESWRSDKKVFGWEDARTDLEVNAQTLVSIRELVRSPVVRFPLVYRGAKTSLRHLSPCKKAAQWLSASSIYHLHQNERKAAIEDVEAIMLANRPLRDEPFLISQLVRVAINAIAVQDCWMILQSNEVTDEELAHLQQSLSDLDLVGPMVEALRGERIWSRDSIHQIRSSERQFADFVDEIAPVDSGGEGGVFENMPYEDEIKGAIRAAIVLPLWRFALSYRDEKHALEEVQVLLEASRSAKSKRSVSVVRDAERAFERKLSERNSSWDYWLTRLFLPALYKGAQRAFRTQTQCEMTIAAIALKRYQLRHGQYPKSLDELVPDFVREVPVDWMDGQKLLYRKEAEAFVLWSVGDDGKDDNGTPDQTDPYSFWTGKDFVWPQPASEGEVSAYHAQIKARQ